MADPSILFVKPKAISRADKKVLRDAGVLVVEIDDPSEAKFIRAGMEISAGATLVAAVTAVSKSDIARKAFGDAMCAAIAADNGK